MVHCTNSSWRDDPSPADPSTLALFRKDIPLWMYQTGNKESFTVPRQKELLDRFLPIRYHITITISNT